MSSIPPPKKPTGPIAGKVQILRHGPQEDKAVTAPVPLPVMVEPQEQKPMTPVTLPVEAPLAPPPPLPPASTTMTPTALSTEPPKSHSVAVETSPLLSSLSLDSSSGATESYDDHHVEAIGRAATTEADAAGTWTRGQKVPAGGKRREGMVVGGEGAKVIPAATRPKLVVKSPGIPGTTLVMKEGPRRGPAPRERAPPADDPEAVRRREARRKEKTERGPRTKGILYRRLPDGRIVNADFAESDGGKENTRHGEGRQQGDGSAQNNRPVSRKGDRFHLDGPHRSKWEGKDKEGMMDPTRFKHEGQSHSTKNYQGSGPGDLPHHNNNKLEHKPVPTVRVRL